MRGFGVVILAALAFGALDVRADGARGELRLINTSGVSWTTQNAWSNVNDTAICDDGGTVLLAPHAVGNWIDGCWADVRGNLSSPASVDEITVYGIKWNVGRRVMGVNGNDPNYLNIGSGGIILQSGGGDIRLFGNHLTVRLTADQSWNCAGAKTTRRYITIGEENRTTKIAAASEDVTLTIADAFTVKNEYDSAFGGNIILKDKACWNNASGRTLGAKRMTLDGPDAAISFTGSTADMFEELELANGGTLTFAGQSWNSSKILASGLTGNVLAGELIVPSGELSIEVAEGATLDIRELSLHDEEGNAVAIAKTGAGTILGPLVVTDTYGGDNPLIIGAGEVVQVWGDGLTADVSVELAGGTLRVCKDGVTVASALTVTEASSISVDEGVEGLFTGAILSAAGKNLELAGKGLKVFSGGAEFSEASSFWHVEGDVLVSNATWSVGAGVDVGMKEHAGKFVIRDNGVLLMAKNANSHVFLVDVTDGDDEGVLEICEGGKVSFGPQSMFRLGSSYKAHGILRINGGIYTDEQASSIQGLGWDSTAFGRIELLKGTYNPTGSIRSGAGKGEFLWRGGTYEINHSGYFSAMVLRTRTNTSAGPSAIPFIIDGPDCVLDVYNYNYPAVTNNTYFGSSYPWYCTERGCLTITNSWEWEGRERAFVVTSAFTNMNLRICDKVNLKVLDVVPSDENGRMFSVNRYEIGPGTPLPEHAISYETAPETPSVGAYRVIAGGTLDVGTYAASTYAFTDLSFDDGAVLAAAPDADGSRPTLAVPGRLTLSDGTLGYTIARGYAAGDIITASSVVGSPAKYVSADGKRRSLEFSVTDTALRFATPGLLLLFR